MQRITNRLKKHINKFCLSILLLTLSGAIFAQSGLIKGIVRDKNTNETLIGAEVVIEGTNIGIITDLDGQFELEHISPGTYKLKVSYISYDEFISDEITVTAGNFNKVEIFLVPTSINLNTVQITGNRSTTNEVSLIKSIKGSVGLANGISSQLISKSQDKDAADVVKRIPGITIIDDKFIIVRGLSQRYNTVWLNNAATPSSETDTKAFSFDVIPSSMIDNIMVYKTAEADFPSDYTGGFIKITTKAIPEENNVVFSYSSSVNQGATFNDFYKYEGSKTDWLGYDNGFRSIPKEMPTNLQGYNNAQNPALQEKVNGIGQSMNKSWEPNKQNAIPDQRFLIGISHKFNMGNRTLGNITALTYSNSNDFNDIKINNNYSIYSYQIDKPSLVDEFHDKQYTNTVKIGFIHNWAINLNKNNKIEFRNLFNQIGYTRTTMRDGREWYNDGRYIKSTELGFLSRSIYSGQLGGFHTMKDNKTKLDWTIGYSKTNKNEPDLKRYRYIQNPEDTTKYMMLFSPNGDLSSQSRRWLDLGERLISGAINFTKELDLFQEKLELKAGIYYERKDREFNSRNFGYASTGSTFSSTDLNPDLIFTDPNHNLTDGIKLIENTDKSDSYTAGSDLEAAYLMFKIPISKLEFNIGLRAEKDKQFLHSYKNGTSTKVDPIRDTLNLFPSVNAIFHLNDKSLFRLAYGKTINRPEFREIAPFYFVDFNLNAGIYGNENIKQAYINNFDLRYELYPSPDEIFTVGAFYKQFTNAIEFIILGNNPTQYSFENIESAYSYGLEIELKKNLEFIGLKNFAVIFNGSLINSQISSGNGDLKRNRPLQGQSPYIVNAGLYYQNDKNGLMINLVYNIIGKRISAVGRPSPNQWEDIPDIYENPRNLVDLSISKKIGRLIEIKGGIKDLLNQKVEFSQNVKTNVDMSLYGSSGTKNFDREQVTKLYYPGRMFTLGITLKI